MESNRQSDGMAASSKSMAAELINHVQRLSSFRAGHPCVRHLERSGVSTRDSAWWLLRQQVDAVGNIHHR
jgi:hypothetical protein